MSISTPAGFLEVLDLLADPVALKAKYAALQDAVAEARKAVGVAAEQRAAIEAEHVEQRNRMDAERTAHDARLRAERDEHNEAMAARESAVRARETRVRGAEEALRTAQAAHEANSRDSVARLNAAASDRSRAALRR
jgi:hypothetical protein